MFFLGKKPKPDALASDTRTRGQAAEDQALAYLQARGLRLLGRNYRTPGRGGGEIDLILQESDGTVVFVEVRSRSHRGFGGAGASIGAAKRQRVALAAQHWLLQHGSPAACRFDAVLIEGADLVWLQAAFDAA
jgi:putative endonuclease